MTNFESYSTIVFIDTMVVLEGPPLSQQPWHEIDGKGPILVLVVPQVQREIDKRKRDGRLSDRARAFNRLLGPSVETHQPVRLCDKRIAVDLMLAQCGVVDWEALDLDRDEGDDRVVGQILSARNVDRSRSVLISHDLNPIAVARTHGITTRILPDKWLLPSEQSAKDKENIKLKSELKDLRKKEPELVLDVAFALPQNFEAQLIAAFSDEEQKQLTANIMAPYREKPAQPPMRLALQIAQRNIGPTTSELLKYESDAIPRYIRSLPQSLEQLFNQIPFTIKVGNIGSVSASKLVVEIEMNGGVFAERFYMASVDPPNPSRYRPFISPLTGLTNISPMFRDEHELYFGVEPDHSEYGELHCKDFRHGKEIEVHSFLTVNPRASSGEVSIGLRATATNMHGDVRQSASLSVQIAERKCVELFDLDNVALQVNFPLQRAVDHAITKEDDDWIEFPDDD